MRNVVGKMVQEGREGNVEFQAVWRVRVSLRRWHLSPLAWKPDAIPLLPGRGAALLREAWRVSADSARSLLRAVWWLVSSRHPADEHWGAPVSGAWVLCQDPKPCSSEGRLSLAPPPRS